VALKKTEVNGNARPKLVMLVYHMPEAQSVSVAGDFCNWRTGCHPMHQDKNGLWTTAIMLPPGRYEYRLVVDGEWRDDPNCRERRPTSSVVKTAFCTFRRVYVAPATVSCKCLVEKFLG
jgi:1,4-alpha-glucan branching enzyme